VAKLWKEMIAASAARSVIVSGYAQQCGSLLVKRRNWGTYLVLVTDRSTETLASLRHVSYPAPQSSVSAEGTTFVSAMMDSHHSLNHSVSFMACGYSQIRSRPHGCTSRLPSGLTEKTKLNVW